MITVTEIKDLLSPELWIIYENVVGMFLTTWIIQSITIVAILLTRKEQK